MFNYFKKKVKYSVILVSSTGCDCRSVIEGFFTNGEILLDGLLNLVRAYDDQNA